MAADRTRTPSRAGARPLVPLACLLTLAFAPLATAQETDADGWREDIRFIEEEFPRRHLEAFHSMSPHRFERDLQRLWERVPPLVDLGEHHVVVRLARALNRVGDGHSGIRLFSDSAAGVRAVPVRLGAYPDGIFVEAAGPGHHELTGARVLAIGDRSAAAALRAVTPLIARDNDMEALRFGPTLLVMPEVLHATGITDSLERVPIRVERDGRRWTDTLSPDPGRFVLEGHGLLDLRASRGGWADARGLVGDSSALLFRDPLKPFWAGWIEDRNAVYVQLNEVADDDDRTLAAFSDSILAAAESLGAERLVLDLRWNRGGNGYLIRPLVRGIVRSAFDEEGRLLVLIGRHTFSAGQMLVNELARLSAPVFIGEPTAAAPNGYGDNEKIILPNSGLTVRAAYLWWQQRDPRDDRRCTVPHVHAPLTFSAYREGRDPALERALSADPRAAPSSEGVGAEEASAERPEAGAIYDLHLCTYGSPRTGSIF